MDRHSVSLLGPGRQQCHFFSNPLFCSSATGKLGGMVKSFIFSVSVRGTWGAEHAITSRLLSSYRSLEISICRLSSVDVRLASVFYHQSSVYQFIFILHCHVYVGDWSTVAACWQRTCLVLRWDVVTSLLQSVTPADTLHRVCCWHGAARDDLVSSVTRLCHHRRGVWPLSRFHFVDQYPVVAVLLVRPVLLAERARAVQLPHSVWGTVSRAFL